MQTFYTRYRLSLMFIFEMCVLLSLSSFPWVIKHERWMTTLYGVGILENKAVGDKSGRSNVVWSPIHKTIMYIFQVWHFGVSWYMCDICTSQVFLAFVFHWCAQMSVEGFARLVINLVLSWVWVEFIPNYFVRKSFFLKTNDSRVRR